jgi:hypothetical protein
VRSNVETSLEWGIAPKPSAPGKASGAAASSAGIVPRTTAKAPTHRQRLGEKDERVKVASCSDYYSRLRGPRDAKWLSPRDHCRSAEITPSIPCKARTTLFSWST